MEAKVTLQEIDRSLRVPSFAGVSGAIVIEAKKGPSQASLVTNESQLLDRYTPNGKVEIGYDLGHYSALAFLERATSLWVKRVTKDALSGGVVIVKEGSSEANASLSAGVSDPSAYLFDQVGDEEEALLIYQANEGAWGNEIKIKIIPYSANPDLVKQPNTFAIQVFKGSNTAVAVETHFCSRNPSALNGYNRSIFVEKVLLSSSYIRAISNPIVDSSVLPKAQSTALALSGGDDGVTAGTSDRIAALQAFANPESISITLMMDGGYAVPAYQKAMDLIAQTRKDCVAILSVPFSAEDSADYINAIGTYRDTDLNMNSSWSALYTGYCLIQDRYNDREIYVSPDGYAAQAISFSAANFELWFPAAGFKRGVLTTVIDVRRRFEEGERDYLYDKGINPIRFFSGRGIVIWGQKTLSSIPSALDRLNVRLLLVVIGPALKTFLENFLFDLNEPDVRNDILGGITNYMDRIQARKGVTSYTPVCDDSNNLPADIDANRLVVDLYISPTRSIEDIPLRMIITSSEA
jgi:Phage tail sheath protein subtilisin-like domain/Phage tail sheath C-terminal domain